MNQGNRLFSLSNENRQRVLTAGFEAITELPDEELRAGYFVARRLGFMLKKEDEFAPDQKDPKYQGEHGLTDDFFTETVRSAIEWHTASKHVRENHSQINPSDQSVPGSGDMKACESR